MGVAIGTVHSRLHEARKHPEQILSWTVADEKRAGDEMNASA
jgi:DNA-directed RNA polymerase specialized sigma24 family protein